MIAIISASAACLAPQGADKWIGSQVTAYSQRSVEIIALALRPGGERLERLIAPNAKFALGAGDVNEPLSPGSAGARALAKELQPASYSYKGWDYIPREQDICGPQKVEVEFVKKEGDRSATVEFDFDHGLLQSAKGWWRSRRWGLMRHAR